MARKGTIKKSNAMRVLDRAGVSYLPLEFEGEEDISRGLGVRMASQVGEDPDAAFKTLVCRAPNGEHVVCCIPVASELDFKKAASAVGEKSLALMPLGELEAVTGYVRGGCSPIGMRKQFPTLIDETAQLFDMISVSGGRRGLSLMVAPDDLRACCNGSYADITHMEYHRGGDSLMNS